MEQSFEEYHKLLMEVLNAKSNEIQELQRPQRAGGIKNVTDWIVKLLTLVLVGSVGYGVTKVEKIGSDVLEIKVWQAQINTAADYDQKSYLTFTAKLEEVSHDVRAIKDTQVKTWDKILELDTRLRELERRVNELSNEVYRARQ